MGCRSERYVIVDWGGKILAKEKQNRYIKVASSKSETWRLAVIWVALEPSLYPSK